MKLVLKLFLFLFITPEFFNLIAQDTDPALRSIYKIEAYRLQPGESFTLNGRMEEPFWENVIPATNFTQQEPNEGGEPYQKTEIYIAYDNDNLYIAAKMHDTYPDGILAYQKRRNYSLETDDRFMWILDTFHDGRNAYFFETNPAGLRGDGLLTVGQSMNLNKAWDGIWDVRTTITDQGWIAEVQIPFRSLDFNPESTTWGINFQRTVRRNNEEILWSGWRRNQGLFRPQNAGILTGLEDLHQGLGLEITPFTTANATRTWSGVGGENRMEADIGFDANYNITPSIRTSLTVNTDFAETEVDERRVNLSRFDISFPEQRDFFLEGAGIFSFVPESGVTPYFSRRIGLTGGEQIPLQAGVQMLGRHRNTTLGLYQIRTGETNISNREDFTAARVRQNILSQSSIGLIYTRRATLDDDFYNDRHTVGADLELNTSRFMGNRNLQFQAFFVWNNMHTPDENSSFWDRTSRGVRLAYPNYPFYGHVSYREFGEAFDPAVGFAPRVAFRRFQPTIGYQQILNDNPLLRSWETSVRFEYLTDLEFDPETIDLEIIPMAIQFESGDIITGGFGYNFERLTFNFDILRDGSIIIPAGDYYSWRLGLNLETASFRKLAATAGINYEEFWTGERILYDFSLTARPFPGINLSGSWSRTDADLAEGSFQTDLLRFTGNVDLTASTAFTNIIQFDNLSDLLGLYNRFRWTIRPGADLYLVHTYNWIRVDDIFNPVETQGAIKFSFTHRF